MVSDVGSDGVRSRWWCVGVCGCVRMHVSLMCVCVLMMSLCLVCLCVCVCVRVCVCAEPMVRNGRPPSSHSMHSFLHQYTGSFKKPPLRRPPRVIGGTLAS